MGLNSLPVESDAISQSCPTLCNPLDCNSPGPLSMGFPRQEFGLGCHFFLQEIFLSQESNPALQADSLWPELPLQKWGLN